MAMPDGDGYRDDYFALLIGNGTFSEGPKRLKNLTGPLNDVQKLQEALTDTQVGLFRPENVEVCPDLDELEIKTRLHRLVQKMSRKSHFLLYYSGHGLDHNGKLALATRTSTSLAYTGLAMSVVLTELSGLRAEQRTLILDCCYAGLAADKSAGSAADALVQRAWGAGNVFLRASDDETAKDALPGHNLSPFTEMLVEGLFEAPAIDDVVVDLSHVYDNYMVKRLEDLQVPTGNLQREGRSIPIARRQPLLGPAAQAPALTTHFEMLDRLVEADTMKEINTSSVSLEEMERHLAALLEVGERLVPTPGRGDGGPLEVAADCAVVGAARAFLHGRLRAPLVGLEAPDNTLTRLRLTLDEPECDRAGLPWEHLPLEDGRAIAWRRGLVLERSVARRFPQPSESVARERIARLGCRPPRGSATTTDPQEIVWQVAQQGIDELARLGVEPERRARVWRGINSGNTDELPPYLLLYPVPRKLPPPHGRGLEVNVDDNWVAADLFVERLTAAQKAGGVSPRLVLVETIAESPSRDAARATAELAHRLAYAGLGHVAFVCHPRGFRGYPPDPEETNDARTFAAYLVHGLECGLDVHRAFHAAVQRMTWRFNDPATEFGVPGLYVTEYDRPEAGGGRPRSSPTHEGPERGGDVPGDAHDDHGSPSKTGTPEAPSGPQPAPLGLPPVRPPRQPRPPMQDESTVKPLPPPSPDKDVPGPPPQKSEYP